MTKKKRNIIIIVAAAILVIAGVIYALTNGKPKIEYTTADVTKGTLLQSVSETGTITPAKEIELNFASAGQLTKLDVKVGDQVNPDQELGQIDNTALAIKEQEAIANLNVSQASVAQAQASYNSAKREYDKLSASLNETLKQAQKTQHDLEDKGPSTVTSAEQAVITAESSLATTKSTYQRGIDNKFDSLQSSVENKLATATAALDSMNSLFNDSDLQPTFSVRNPAVLSSAKDSYAAGHTLLIQANAKLATAKSARSLANLDAAYDSAQSTLDKIFEALNFTFSALENTPASASYNQARLDAAKTIITTQNSAISSAVNALQIARQALDDAQLAYDTNVLSAQQNLNQANVSLNNALLTARNAVATAQSNRDQQLASAQTRIDNAHSSVEVTSAQIGQASANLSLVRNQMSDNILKSPIKGVITKVNYGIGEQVSAQKALVSVLTENNYQIEVDISETDIAKLKLNDTAELTLDALGPDIKFQGLLYSIEPGATVIQGVTYYKVKISFDPGTQPVKPGMTASAIIMTNRRDNILMMPARAVVEHDGKTFVRILTGQTVNEVPVTIGLSGDNGIVEVVSGVNEGDKVVTFVKDSSKK